jgi:hypothetical protein
MIDNSKEYILCAAIKRKEPREGAPYWEGTNDIMNIELGYRHHDIFHRFNNRDIHQNYEDCEVSILMEDQGFYTSKGRFVDRYEGMKIAHECGQVWQHLIGQHTYVTRRTEPRRQTQEGRFACI